MAPLFLNELRTGMLISPFDAPGDIGLITHLEPTTDKRGKRITVRLLGGRVARHRTARWLVWNDEYATFNTHRPEDYFMTNPDNTPTDAHDEDDKPMTEAEARAHFEAMGIEIVDNITIIS